LGIVCRCVLNGAKCTQVTRVGFKHHLRLINTNTTKGRLRNMLYTNGEYFDELYFGLTRAEWDQIDPPRVMERFSPGGEARDCSP
jgi:hypothetical protein